MGSNTKKCDVCMKVKSIAQCDVCDAHLCHRHRRVFSLKLSAYHATKTTKSSRNLCPACADNDQAEWVEDEIEALMNKVIKYERKNHGSRSR